MLLSNCFQQRGSILGWLVLRPLRLRSGGTVTCSRTSNSSQHAANNKGYSVGCFTSNRAEGPNDDAHLGKPICRQ
jgi:hypothetical protein